MNAVFQRRFFFSFSFIIDTKLKMMHLYTRLFTAMGTRDDRDTSCDENFKILDVTRMLLRCLQMCLWAGNIGKKNCNIFAGCGQHLGLLKLMYEFFFA